MVEVAVVGTKEEEKYLLLQHDEYEYGRGDADDDDGEEKLTVMVIDAGTKVVDEEEKKIKSRTATEQTTMSSTNVKAAGDHPTVDGEKLKARVKRLSMWSLLYFLLYWIRLVIKRDYYEVGLMYACIPFPLGFFISWATLTLCVLDNVNSLVLFMNPNIPPPPSWFKSSTTTATIDQMKKGIGDNCGNILTISFIYNHMHMLFVVLAGTFFQNEVGSAKWYESLFQMLYAGCIFFVILMHYACEQQFHKDQQRASIDQPHTDNTTNVM